MTAIWLILSFYFSDLVSIPLIIISFLSGVTTMVTASPFSNIKLESITMSEGIEMYMVRERPSCRIIDSASKTNFIKPPFDLIL